MKRHGLLTLFFGAVALSLSVQTSSAQFLSPYLSQDEVVYATQAAKDSIGNDALLVGIAAPGEVDLSAIFPGVVEDGFNPSSGTSAVWGYLFMKPSRSDSIGVAVLKLSLGGLKQVYAEREGDYDQDPVPLDLTGAYAGSDAFANQLQNNAIFTKYISDYPDEIPDAAVLSWRPEGAEFVGNLPGDKPIWAIYYPGDFDAIPPMACFTASGTGETVCLVIDEPTDGVKDAEESAVESLTISPNPASAKDQVVIRVRPIGDQKPSEIALYDVAGREVRSLEGMAQPSGTGEYTITVDLAELPAGRYYCRVVAGEKISSVPLIVE